MRAGVALVLLATAAGFAGWVASERMGTSEGGRPARGGGSRVAPVEVVAITRGPIEQRRTFTGTLVAAAEFVVAPKVSGRIRRIDVDLADTVARDQVVAKLDDAEFVQAVATARADAVVAQANLAEAQAQLLIAERELERVTRLRERGVTSESELDSARAQQLARQATVQVTRAQLTRAQAEVQAARIRLGYTEVTAGWPGGSDQRVVAERYVDEGETVSANAPLLRIVEVDPASAVFFVTERDYGLLRAGQIVSLSTDAFPGEHFQGRITRIAPVFREATRQARVEVRADNHELRLKPGMFVRLVVVLQRVEDAVLLPAPALTQRGGITGVFVLDATGTKVAWQPVRAGIRDGDRVQLLAGDVVPDADVVVLGQQLLEDGSAVVVGSPVGRR